MISSSFLPRTTRNPSGFVITICSVGEKLWTVEGVGEGALVGTVDAGLAELAAVGDVDGLTLGAVEGLLVGVNVMSVGRIVGDALGTAVGLVVEVGELVGEGVGTVEG